MIKNIVITGGKYSGKSTLAQKYISYLGKEPAGFVIKRIITPVGGPIYALEDIKSKHSEIITTQKNNGIEGIKPVFDDFGASVVKRAVNSSYQVVLFDEIGRFEKDSDIFIKAIESSFNSNKTIVAILKKYDLPYIVRIKNRDDIILVDLDYISFDKAYEILINNK